MKVVILNSGRGSRMGSLTDDRPKCLVEISPGETILSRQLKILQKLGWSEVLITTGPFAYQIEKHVKDNFKGLKVEYVNNPLFNETNYIYSLLLAGEKINNSLLLLHGDLVFETEVMHKLVQSVHEDAVLVNSEVELPEKDFKALIDKGLVKKIGVDVFGSEAAFLVPIYKLSKRAFQGWLKEMKVFQDEGKVNVYAEDALNNLLDRIKLHPVDYDGFCTEIDDLADLEKTRRYLAAGEG